MLEINLETSIDSIPYLCYMEQQEKQSNQPSISPHSASCFFEGEDDPDETEIIEMGQI